MICFLQPKDGAWREVGDRIVPGKDSVRFFEMNLKWITLLLAEQKARPLLTRLAFGPATMRTARVRPSSLSRPE
jgi:hypothetical protein